MYGTIAGLKIRQGEETAVVDWIKRAETESVEGLSLLNLYRMDANPEQYYMVVAFDDKDAYVANAKSPEQDRRYRDLLALLEGPPEWHDGELICSAEIVHSGL